MASEEVELAATDGTILWSRGRRRPKKASRQSSSSIGNAPTSRIAPQDSHPFARRLWCLLWRLRRATDRGEQRCQCDHHLDYLVKRGIFHERTAQTPISKSWFGRSAPLKLWGFF